MVHRQLFLHQRRNTEPKKEIQILKTETKLIVRSAFVKGSVRNHESFRDMLKNRKNEDAFNYPQ